MNERIPIKYGEFYDFPRQIDFELKGECFYLCSEFDEQSDEYQEHYNVYLLPFRSREELEANECYWMDLSKAVHLGQIRIVDIGLDETRRQSIDGRHFQKWLSGHRQ